jgi:hypothetical protein
VALEELVAVAERFSADAGDAAVEKVARAYAALTEVLGVDAVVEVRHLRPAAACCRVKPGPPRGLALRVSDSQWTAFACHAERPEA